VKEACEGELIGIKCLQQLAEDGIELRGSNARSTREFRKDLESRELRNREEGKGGEGRGGVNGKSPFNTALVSHWCIQIRKQNKCT
jgi:hypothetical protein